MMRRGLGMLIAVAMAILACSLPFGPAVEDNTVPATVDRAGTSGGGVILEDDFADPSTGWEVGEYDGGRVGYFGDTYQVESYGDGQVMWGVAGGNFNDVVIEVRTFQATAPSNDNNGYGVVCRAQENGDGYYLRISGDGFYSITKAIGDEWIDLVEWTESSAIQQGNANNNLRAICDGTSLTLEVNGQRMATASDREFSSGDIAMTVASYEDAASLVHFDDVRVTQP